MGYGEAHMQKLPVGIYIAKPKSAAIDVFKRAFLHLTRSSSLLMLTHMFFMVLISHGNGAEHKSM